MDMQTKMQLNLSCSFCLHIQFAEHLGSVGTGKENLIYRVIDGAKDLSKEQAKVLEQTLINQYGIQKNGGQLINKMNSISPKKWEANGIKK